MAKETSNNRNKQNPREAADSFKNMADLKSKVPISNHLNYTEFLGNCYEYIKSRQNYSFNQMSEDFGLSYSNALWLIIKGKRKLIKTTAEKIAKAMKFNNAEKNYLLALVQYCNTSIPETRETHFKRLLLYKQQLLGDSASLEELKYLSEWFHPLVRELVAMGMGDLTPKHISDRLTIKINPKKIKDSLDLLVNLGLIEKKDDDNGFKEINDQIMPKDEIVNIGKIRYHQKMCEVARDSIGLISQKEREINSLTVSIDDTKLENARAIIREACVKIMELESTSEVKNRIYQVNMHCFPLTKNI